MKVRSYWRPIAAAAALLLAVGPLAACGSLSPATPATPVPAKPAAVELTILHTNDNRGYVEPCG